MVEGDDVYGDGVNIAARLQQLADPGGILISGPVYDQVHNKLSISFDALGPQLVKNVSNPVMSYRVNAGDATSRESKVSSAGKAMPAAGSDNNIFARIWQQYLRLPRWIAAICAVIGFLFLVNVFSGLDEIWFHWPALPFLLVVVLWAVFRKKG
jgi:adenylate cyclase